jgi:uncharacterized protein
MLLEFRFKNFKSFKDGAVLSLVASSDKTLPENLLTCADDKTINVLSSLAIYGANASGKSTIFDAFDFFKNFIEKSAQKKPGDAIGVRPFIFDDEMKKAPSTFEITFIQNDIRYQYGFIVSRLAIHQEWLISYPKGRARKLFERVLKPSEKENEYTYEYKFGSLLKGEKNKLIELTHPSALFLSIASTFNNQEMLTVYRWFTDRAVLLSSDDFNERDMFRFVAKNPTLSDDIKEMIKFADLGIEDYTISEEDLDFNNSPQDASPTFNRLTEAISDFLAEQVKTNPDIDKKIYNLKMKHRAGDNLIPIPWKDESDGTQRFFGLAGPIFQALKDGKVVFIDEIDRSLHPLLVRELIKLFQNPHANPNNAQLLFNTHDTSLLGIGMLRRDQIWFLEKDQAGASHLYPLLEYSPRKDESLEKGYLQGRYGAIPFLGDYPFGGK